MIIFKKPTVHTQQLGFSLLLVILIITVLIVVGMAGYSYKTYQEVKKIEKEPEIVKPEQVIDETADWKTYRNEEYGFEFKYPAIYDTEKYRFCRVNKLGGSFDSFKIGTRTTLNIIDSKVLGFDEAAQKYIDSIYEIFRGRGGEMENFEIKSKDFVTIGGKEVTRISYKFKGPIAISDEENDGLTDSKVLIVAVNRNSPAELAGLKIGDYILELKFKDEKLRITKVKKVQEFIDLYKDKTIILTIQRGKKIFHVILTPRVSSPEFEGPLGVGLIRVVIRDRSEITALLQKDGMIFIFQFSAGDLPTTIKCDYEAGGISEFNVYNQILSTFRFLE